MGIVVSDIPQGKAEENEVMALKQILKGYDVVSELDNEDIIRKLLKDFEENGLKDTRYLIILAINKDGGFYIDHDGYASELEKSGAFFIIKDEMLKEVEKIESDT